MDGGHAVPRGPATLSAGALSALMPLHVMLDAAGQVVHVGPTAGRLIGADAAERGFFRLFAVRRLHPVRDMAQLGRCLGQRLTITRRGPVPTRLLGVAVPCGDGVLVNLSFGSGLDTAVRDLCLTVADFAPTDLAVDLLYLVEAKATLMDELGRVNGQLFAAKSAAETAALTDMLTGLVNRRGFDQHLARCIASGQPFALLQIDLDFFKQVNDSLGHAAGDLVLVAAAQAMLRATRAGDVVARLGGDEFAMILPGQTDPETLMVIARRLIARLETPVSFEGRDCRISASVGIATLRPGEGATALVARADEALYAAKRAGRGRPGLAPA
jgi:diguanylate cyclase (GGDEF)-like protein